MSEQPMPTTGRTDVVPEALWRFFTTMQVQESRGLETYGTTLQTWNGRDAFRDAMEEMVDAFKYVTQAMLESADKDAEIARLRARVAELEAAAGDGRARGEMGRAGR